LPLSDLRRQRESWVKAGKGKKDRESIENWQMNTDTMDLYGNFYLKRAIIALIA